MRAAGETIIRLDHADMRSAMCITLASGGDGRSNTAVWPLERGDQATYVLAPVATLASSGPESARSLCHIVLVGLSPHPLRRGSDCRQDARGRASDREPRPARVAHGHCVRAHRRPVRAFAQRRSRPSRRSREPFPPRVRHDDPVAVRVVGPRDVHAVEHDDLLLGGARPLARPRIASPRPSQPTVPAYRSRSDSGSLARIAHRLKRPCPDGRTALVMGRRRQRLSQPGDDQQRQRDGPEHEPKEEAQPLQEDKIGLDSRLLGLAWIVEHRQRLPVLR